MIMEDEFSLGERVQVVEPVVWPDVIEGADVTHVFAPGEDLYVVSVPPEGHDRYTLRCPATGVQGDVFGALLVSMPQHGETLQKALQTAHRGQQVLMGTVVKLQEMVERAETATEHGPAFVNLIFDGPPDPYKPFHLVETEDDSGKGFRAGEWRDRGDGTWALRMPYGASFSEVSEFMHANLMASMKKADEYREVIEKVVGICRTVGAEDVTPYDGIVEIRNAILSEG